MKNTAISFFVCLVGMLLIQPSQTIAQLPGLDVEMNGILLPRLTTSERDNLTAQPGLMIFNTTTNCIEFYRVGGWYNMCEEIANCSDCDPPASCPVLNELYGADGFEYAKDMLVLYTGEIVATGFSNSSMSGDISEMNNSNGNLSDIWIFKIDTDGVIIWENLIGTLEQDWSYALVETNDGNIVVSGHSWSNGNNDFSGPSNGNADAWLVKVDQTNGQIMWEENYGSSFYEYPVALEATSDGGVIFACFTRGDQGDGDISDVSNGENDVWVVKTDVSGAIEWDYLYGSSGGEYPESIQQTADGGYLICAGTNTSVADGDVSEVSFGGGDVWILKIDGSGNTIWDSTFGGSNDEILGRAIEASNGNIVVATHTDSTDGDVTDTSNGFRDFWMVVLDPDGEIIGDYLFGGSGEELFKDMIELSDGNLLLSGYTTSPTSGDVSNDNGDLDSWIIKVDQSGTIIWNVSPGGDEFEDGVAIKEESNGCIILLSESRSSQNGDVTDINNGENDYWLLRLNPDGTIAQ